MKKQKKVLRKIKRPTKLGFLCYLGDTQGCGTIRVIYPYLLLNHYRKRDLMINTTGTMHYISDPQFYKDFTFVQFQRAATEGHLNLIHHFKKHIQPQFKTPVVYEIDDMLFNIPEWNYASLYYGQAEEIIKKIMRSVDGMVVSTAKLREVYGEYCKNIAVIPNHLPKFIWGDIFPAHDYYEGGKVKILWAGSQNHFGMKDVTKDSSGGDFGKELLDFIKKTVDVYEWHLMGAMPAQLSGLKNKIKWHPWQDIFNYPRVMKGIEADIGIAPLNDTPFNHCKSNIKCLEYTAAGMVGVYSDVTPYKFQSCTAKTDEEMIAHIEKLAGDVNYRKGIFNKDKERVRNQLFWEDNHNIKRYINTYLGLFGNKL